MLFSRTFFVLVAIGCAVLLMFWNTNAPPSLTPTVKDHLNEFSSAINRELNRVEPACIKIYGPFPRSPVWNHFPCDACKGLESGGFLEFTDGKFHLLEPARPYYKREDSMSKFCFGETRVHQIIESLPAHTVGGVRWISMKYVPEIHSPAPFLFTAEARELNLPEPVVAKDTDALWLSHPQMITFSITLGGDIIEALPGHSYGKYALAIEADAWHH